MSETDSTPRPPAPRMAWWGESCALALGTSLVAAVPTALRTRGAGGGLFDGLLVATAVWLCLLLPLTLLRGRVARGWRGLAGAQPPRLPATLLALFAGWSVALLVLLGSLLKATTHHRGLGGAAFGVGGLAVVGACALGAVRLSALGRWLGQRGVPARAVEAGLWVLAVGPLLWAVTLLVRPADPPGPVAGWAIAAVVDLLLALFALGLVVGRGLPAVLRRPARLAAVPVVLFVVGAGFGRVELGEGVGAALRAGGGVPATLLRLLAAWSDRDGDGASAHLGGGDCDEGDPARRPGAVDRDGDGVDSDCDGADAPRHAARPATPRGATRGAAVRSAAAAAGLSAAPGASRPSGDGEPAASASVPSEARPAAGSPAARPDLVLVTLDAVGAAHSSAAGYGKPTTPNLASLARRGLDFVHAYAIGPTTQRALVPLVTGRPLSESRRSADEWPTLLDDNDTVAERLGRAGYATGAVTSFTWLRQDRGFHQGFDRFDESAFRADHPERGTTAEAAVAAAARLYAELAGRSGPLFLWVHLFDAHEKFVEHPGLDFGATDEGRYDGEIAFVDQRIGALVELLAKSPRSARTLLVVHGSHGIAWGEHGERGHGRELYDEAIRVPLVVVAPWAKAARYEKHAVSTLDLAPTLLDYAGASREGVRGMSLRAIVEGDRESVRPPVLAYTWRRVAVVDWPHKLLVKRREGGSERLLLYDLAADPGEQRDLSAAEPKVFERLIGHWRAAAESEG